MSSARTIALMGGPDSDSWLARFHAGDRVAFEQCYREHFDAVENAVGRVLVGADKETVIHDVFYALLSNERVRRGYRGGSMAAWISAVARNRAVDHLRRFGREQVVTPEAAAELVDREDDRSEERMTAQLLVDQFRERILPSKWAPVFEARFIERLSQREAAAKLGMRRTTLAYQELKVDRLLKRFVLQMEEP